jgi:hypothetical protein
MFSHSQPQKVNTKVIVPIDNSHPDAYSAPTAYRGLHLACRRSFQDPLPAKIFERQYAAFAYSTFILTFSAACYSIFLGSYLSIWCFGRGSRLYRSGGSGSVDRWQHVWGYRSDVTG